MAKSKGGKKPGTSVSRTTKVEAKTKKGRRLLDKRAPQQVEYCKHLLLLYGRKTSQTIKDVLRELKHLRDKMECTHLTRKNDNIAPFENGGETSLEFLCGKTNCGAFVLGSHTKKRPNNLTFGRVYDEKIYDLFEVGVERFVKQDTSVTEAKTVFSPKPSFAFAGDEFETDSDYKQFKSIVIDSFRGRVVDTINLKGVDRIIMCTPVAGTESESKTKRVMLRHYAIKLKKSGTRVPRVELVDIGPSLDLSFRCVRLQSARSLPPRHDHRHPSHPTPMPHADFSKTFSDISQTDATSPLPWTWRGTRSSGLTRASRGRSRRTCKTICWTAPWAEFGSSLRTSAACL